MMKACSMKSANPRVLTINGGSSSLLVQRMVPVAHRGLRHLRNQRLRVTRRQMLQITACCEFSFQNTRPEPAAVASALHHRTARGAFPAHDLRAKPMRQLPRR